MAIGKFNCTHCGMGIVGHKPDCPKVQKMKEARDSLCCVLTRGIPVDGVMTDTLTHICSEGETVADLWKWVEKQTEGSAWIVRVEIVKST